MNEELKEILEDIEDYSKNEYLPPCCELTNKDCKLLLDYITNLQEENEYTNYCNEQLRKKITNLEYKINSFEDYKSRNEKAIEDIDLVIELIKQQPTEDDNWILNRLNGFKYLLQGEDKDE